MSYKIFLSNNETIIVCKVISPMTAGIAVQFSKDMDALSCEKNIKRFLEETIRVEEFLGKKVDIDFMFFSSDFIHSCLKKIGFKDIEIIEREPYPEVEYQSRRAYVFAKKPSK